MTNKIKPFAVHAHNGDVGHSVVFGPTRAGMSLTPVIKELFENLQSGHPGVKVSLAQAGSAEAKRGAQRKQAPYYRQFDKRK
ncbi:MULTISPECIES: hypothetical protein [Burkholderia cepacia complex]|nr:MULTISPECIES: hypothetical protein [Burkholderia cepacia complex]